MEKAIGMVEFSSISRGIYAADQMVKVSEVEIVSSTTSCPATTPRPVPSGRRSASTSRPTPPPPR